MKTLKEIEEEFGSFDDHVQKAAENDDDEAFNYWNNKKIEYYKEHIRDAGIKDQLLEQNYMLKFSFRVMERLINEAK